MRVYYTRNFFSKLHLSLIFTGEKELMFYALIVFDIYQREGITNLRFICLCCLPTRRSLLPGRQMGMMLSANLTRFSTYHGVVLIFDGISLESGVRTYGVNQVFGFVEGIWLFRKSRKI